MTDEATTRKESAEPSWLQTGFPALRRVVVFLLGVAIIIDALWAQKQVVGELIVGMIMVGILPIDEVIRAAMSRRRERGG